MREEAMRRWIKYVWIAMVVVAVVSMVFTPSGFSQGPPVGPVPIL